jgi:photosystem II stability/assembly factor-like uncharacterized protein
MKRYGFFIIFLLISGASAWEWISSGPEGGFLKDFAFHPDQTDILFAGSDDSGGIWRSINGGVSWELVSAGFPDMTGWSIVICQSDPSIVFACDSYARYGLLKSTDGGSTWTQSTGGLTSIRDLTVMQLVIASENADSLYICTGMADEGYSPRPGSGVFRSMDGGLTWTPSGLQGTTVPCMCRDGNGTLFAGTDGTGVWQSSDGNSWTHVDGIPDGISIWQIEAGNSYLAVATFGAGVFISTNSGADFTQYFDESYCWDLSIAESDPELVLFAAVDTGVFRYSSISGSWTGVMSSPLSDSLIVMGISSDSQRVLCSEFANSPVIRSSDSGQSWSYTQSSPEAVFLSGIAVDPSDSGHFFSSSLGSYANAWNISSLYETCDSGQSWTSVGPAAHGTVVLFSSTGTLFLGTFRKGLYRSYDYFQTWENVRPGDKVIFDIAIDTDNSDLMLLSEYDLSAPSVGLYRSTDGGGTFAPVLSGLCSPCLFGANSSYAWVGMTDGLYRSQDDGLTWSPWMLSGHVIMTLCEYGTYLLAGTEQGKLFLLTEDSQQQEITGPWIQPVRPTGFLVSGDTLYTTFNGAEMDSTYVRHGGVWMTSDVGQNWTDLTDGMIVTHVYGKHPISVTEAGITVSTYGGGCQILIGVSGINESTVLTVPGIHVYPNPASGSIELCFRLQELSDSAELLIFDCSGRLVCSKEITDPDDGYRSVIWDCRDESGYRVFRGIYHCIVKPMTGPSLTGRMIVI